MNLERIKGAIEKEELQLQLAKKETEIAKLEVVLVESKKRESVLRSSYRHYCFNSIVSILVAIRMYCRDLA